MLESTLGCPSVSKGQADSDVDSDWMFLRKTSVTYSTRELEVSSHIDISSTICLITPRVGICACLDWLILFTYTRTLPVVIKQNRNSIPSSFKHEAGSGLDIK